MKKNLALILPTLLLVLALAGCGILGLGDTTPTVVEPSEADAALYQQIAVLFVTYYEADAGLPSETETSYSAAVTAWSTTGSTWATYSTIAPPYVSYLHNDLDMTRDSVDIRTDTVLAWKIFLENTAGPAPGVVFDPKETTYNP